jgi:hypothetical protein
VATRKDALDLVRLDAVADGCFVDGPRQFLLPENAGQINESARDGRYRYPAPTRGISRAVSAPTRDDTRNLAPQIRNHLGARRSTPSEQAKEMGGGAAGE